MNIHAMSQSGNLSPQYLMDYFRWPPKLVAPPKKTHPFLTLFVLFIVLPLVACIITSSSPIYVTALAVVGILLVTFFVYRAIKKRNSIPIPPPPIPSDQEYEDWVRSWQNAIRQYGMQKLGLSAGDVVGKSLYIRSIVWPDSHEAKFYRSYNMPLLVKYGRDGRPHASINKYTFFYPTQHYIAVFMGDVNALGTMRFEGTRTYFYDDIVGVETSAMNLNDGYTTYAMQHFELRVSSGQSIGATTYVHDLDVDQTVQALRTLLRDKKYGIRGGNYGAMNS
jgi:hypothetical protein